MVPNNVNNSFFDYLIGEYQYIELGDEIINTLGNTDTNNLGIYGKYLLKNTYRPYCSDCPENERRIGLILSDKITGLSSQITLKRIEIGGQDALEIFIRGGSPRTYDVNNPPAYLETILPSGTLIFIKE